MRKLDYNFDQDMVDEFVREIQKLLPEYKVDVTNVNDFSILYRDRECCRVCKGLSQCGNLQQGYYQDYTDGDFVNRECKYKREDKIKHNKQNLIKTLYLSTTILNADLDDYYTNCESRRKIYTRISEFIVDYKNKNVAKGLYLYGGFSTGKTYTLAAIANELGRNDISCLLIYFPDLVVDLKNAIGSTRYESLINMLKSVDVLMLDDVGSENMTPWLRDDVLGSVINYRVNEYKPVFISSNLNPNQLVDHLSIDKTPANSLKGRRIMNRLKCLMNSISMDDSHITR